MKFSRGFTKPVCSPSRAMVLTGLYSHRVGIPDYIAYGNPVKEDRGLPGRTETIGFPAETSRLRHRAHRKVASRLWTEIRSKQIRIRYRGRLPLHREGNGSRRSGSNSVPGRRKGGSPLSPRNESHRRVGRSCNPFPRAASRDPVFSLFQHLSPSSSLARRHPGGSCPL